MTGFVFFAHPPSPLLAPFLSRLWGVRGAADYHVESVLPNGAMDLMVNLGPRQKIVAYGERAVDQEFHRAWIAGMQDQPLVHASRDGVNHVAATFRPGGAHAFFDLPIDEFTDQVVELEDVIGAPATDQLWTRLRETDGDEARCRVLEHWLLERRVGVHPWFATVRRAVDLLRAGAPGTPVAQVCEALGLSNRHLIAQFRRTVGLTPKAFGRIHRFQRVIDACRGKSRVRWAQVAAQAGFADQSHLIREFRRLALATPEEFLATRTPDESAMVVE